MKRQIAAIMTGMVLAMSATTLPALAKVSRTTTQPSVAGQQQKQVFRTTGARMQQQKWSINQKKGVMSRLTPSERTKLKQFKAGIERGLSPQASAKKVGITKVTRLNSPNNRTQKRTSGRYQMRLSLSPQTSATIRVNNRTKVVTVARVATNAKRLQTLSQRTKARYQQRRMANTQIRPSLGQKASAKIRVKGQTKVAKAKQVRSNVKRLQALSKSTKARYQPRRIAKTPIRPSLGQKASVKVQAKGQTKVVTAKQTGNKVKPVQKLSQNKPVLPR